MVLDQTLAMKVSHQTQTAGAPVRAKKSQGLKLDFLFKSLYSLCCRVGADRGHRKV